MTYPRRRTVTNTAETRRRYDLATRRRNNSSRGALAAVLVCVLAGALLTAGSATAASRGYKLYNHSRHALRVESATALPTEDCFKFVVTLCIPTHYRIGFEGRPGNRAWLWPGGVHNWELKYGFNFTYAALLRYKIVGTDGIVEYAIMTSAFANDSTCKVVPSSVARCTGEGLKLTFSNH